ncbi:putative metalloprotease CJM1_0395 family protein [Sulfurimonas sp. C5]|nr:putative metalloprotease CJM1_0395 family protein [Sulfurimonas sp. C5]MDH4945111.1 putative metalloprotease CJM1_0395 family protein [Sulfurimonas sp. C5]
MQISSNSSYDISNQNKSSSQEDKKEEKSSSTTKLDASQQQEVNKLQARDSEVRAHEAAHKAAGGGLAGSASFSYQRGPDGKMYAIGGEVPISFEKGATPQETISNARQVAAAAMAPANPSPQDFSVASSARMMELTAQQELVKQLQEEQNQQTGLKTYKQSA